MQLGKITHYYDHIGVAVVKIMKKPLAVGDTVKISHGDDTFTQTVESLQKEHEQLKKAKPGDIVGMKVDKPVKEGYILSSITKK
jgi:translation elongation factor EF-1alpha